MPLTSVVLPAPRSPRSSTISGGASKAASFFPKAMVSSAEWVTVVVVGTPGQYNQRKYTASRVLGSESRWCLELRRDRIEKTAVKRGIQRHAQLAMIVVAQSDEPERL